MAVQIQYSILKYIHSRVYDEVLNVGVFVYDIERNYSKLFIPSDLSRLNNLYPDFKTSFLKTVLRSLKNKVENQKSKYKFDFDTTSSNKSLLSHILRPDDTSLEFGELRKASLPEWEFVEDFIKGFLPYAEGKGDKVTRLDEEYLRRTFYSQISTIEDVKEKVKRDIEISHNRLNLKVDFEWANGTTNLVKAVSFDYKDASSIHSKVFQAEGYLNHFKDYLEEKNCRFDLLFSHPSDKNLFKEYDKALEIIESLEVNKKIIEDDNIKVYAEEAIASLSR